MYYVIYYPVGMAREVKNGFASREQAWKWVEPRVISGEVDAYFIERENQHT